MKLTNEEKLIKFLIGKFQESTRNQVGINLHELPQIRLTEKEVIQSVYVLKEDNLIDIVGISDDDDLSMTCTVSLKSSCIHYFDNKKAARNFIVKEWIWWGITTIIAILAIIKP